MILRQLGDPYFPFRGNGRLQSIRIDWTYVKPLRLGGIGKLVADTNGTEFEKILEVPINVILAVSEIKFSEPLIPVLNTMKDMTAEIVIGLEQFYQ